jgi:hypothetical protein
MQSKLDFKQLTYPRTSYCIFYSDGREYCFSNPDSFQQNIDIGIRAKYSFIAKDYKRRVFWLIKKGRVVIDRKIF